MRHKLSRVRTATVRVDSDGAVAGRNGAGVGAGGGAGFDGRVNGAAGARTNGGAARTTEGGGEGPAASAGMAGSTMHEPTSAIGARLRMPLGSSEPNRRASSGR